MTKYFRNKLIKGAVCAVAIGGVTAGLIIGNNLADFYESNITGLLCPSVVDEEKSKEATSAGNELAVQIESEGIVMVQNRGGDAGVGVLPLDNSIKKVNVFGRGAIEWHYSGTGSGGVKTNKVDHIDLCQALEEEGIEVNRDLVNASKSVNAFVEDRGNLDTSTLTTSRTFEPKISEYQSAYNDAKNFSDTALIVFGRYAGEGNDLAKTSRKLSKYNGGVDETRTTLDFSTEEQALVEQVAQDFKNVIVIINSTNVMNLEYVESIPGVDACLVVGTPGCVGARAIKKVLWGEAVPSGHLADTYAYDFKTLPNYFNSGYDYFGVYTGSGARNGAYAACSYRSAKSAYRGRENADYVDYDDGIYVGYRWYETADAEGFWNNVNNSHGTGYDGVVQYPFGYGLSYVSNFEWELVNDKCSPASGSAINENTEIELTVKVTNRDAIYSGKDVVQVYLTAPYDPVNAPIEKSYVSLVGFAKTPILGPGQSVDMTIKMNSWDFKSFDDYDINDNDHTGYELEAGDYVLRFRTDSHHDKEMTGGNTITYNVPNTIKITEDKDTHAPIVPVLNANNPVDGFAIDGSDTDQNIEYLSRAKIRNKTYSLPTAKPADRNWNTVLEVSKGGTTAQPESHNVGNNTINMGIRYNTYSQEMARAWDNKTGNDPFGNPIPTEKPVFGASNKVTLWDGVGLTEAGKKCAADYNDPLWEQALDGITYSDATNIIKLAHPYSRPALSDVGIPKLADQDGPSQICTSANPSMADVGTGYPNPTVIAQTWNEKLALDLGKSFARDMAGVGMDGVYGFACNIHRTPFGGRNFEYYSEDPFLSGRQASQSCKGVQVSGKTTYLKHFVCNDQETWRCGIYTWMTEQSFREIYAKPFEIVIKDDTTTAIMSSFNRVGATWAGGSEAANQGIIRNEWGFHGAIKTDYGEDCDVMDFAQCVRAGETIGLADSIPRSCDGSVPDLSAITPRFAHRIRECAHEIAYAFLHAQHLMNNYSESGESDGPTITTVSKRAWVWWKPVLFALETILVCGVILGTYFALRPLDLESRKEAPEGAGDDNIGDGGGDGSDNPDLGATDAPIEEEAPINEAPEESSPEAPVEDVAPEEAPIEEPAQEEAPAENAETPIEEPAQEEAPAEPDAAEENNENPEEGGAE